MRTTTPAVNTRPSFFAFRLIRHASVVANILHEKFGPGDEANWVHYHVYMTKATYMYMLASTLGWVKVAINKKKNSYM